MRPPKKSDYPRRVKVGVAAVPYRIVFGYKKNLLGEASYDKKTIWLNKRQTNKQLFMTFIHELLHTIEFETGTRVKHRIIYSFEEGLYTFFLNNISTFGFKK